MKLPTQLRQDSADVSEPPRGLLSRETFEGPIWEPACGHGAITSILSDAGYSVISTDLIERDLGEGGIDFLEEKALRAPNVVTNPPFRLWSRFAQHALSLGATKIVLMNKNTLLGNIGTTRLMRETGLARVLIAAGRVNILPPGVKDRGFGARNGNYTWFIWERGHSGPPTIDWFEPARFRNAKPGGARG